MRRPIAAVSIVLVIATGCSKEPEPTRDAGADVATAADVGSDAAAAADSSVPDTGTAEDTGADVNLVNPEVCDPIAQDCVEPGASMCGLVHDLLAARFDTECRAPLGDAQLGESCSVPNGNAGEDTCAGGLFCSFADLPKATPQPGECRALCNSDEQCLAGEGCFGIDGVSEYGICRTACDPLGDDCVAGTHCTLAINMLSRTPDWICMFDVGVDPGTACMWGSGECGAGQACLPLSGPPSRTCEELCSDDRPCSGDRACQPISNVPGWGYCA